MKTSRLNPTLILTCGTALISAAMLNSCKLPSENNWRTVQTSGLIPALLDSENQQQVAQKKTGPAPLKVSPVIAPRIIDVPVGEPVQGRPGYVYSPFAPERRIVDVREFKAGEEVRCPITLKSFLVPDFNKAVSDQAAIAGNQKPTGPEVVSVDPGAGLANISLTNPKGTRVPDGSPSLTSPEKPMAAPNPPANAPAELPFGRRVAGRPGFVYSPYASQYQLVDVAGIAPGVEVRCPYTNKLFRVPQPLPEESGKPAEQPKEQPKPEEKKQDKPKETPKEQPKPEEKKQEQPKPTPVKAEAKPEPKPEAKPQPAADNGAPTATWAQKDKGLVQSPFGQPGQLVDVTGKTAGAKVVCPFTGKTFLVPGQ